MTTDINSRLDAAMNRTRTARRVLIDEEAERVEREEHKLDAIAYLLSNAAVTAKKIRTGERKESWWVEQMAAATLILLAERDNMNWLYPSMVEKNKEQYEKWRKQQQNQDQLIEFLKEEISPEGFERAVARMRELKKEEKSS